MEQTWLFNLLIAAKDEIKALRAENKIMSARLKVFDNMMSLLNTHKPQPGQSVAPDIVYDIEKATEEFKPKEKPPIVAETLCTKSEGEGSLSWRPNV